MSNSIKKIIHIVIIITIVVVILCTAGIFIILYQVEGETNMPFHITKIIIAQNVDAIENDASSATWNLNVCENNDMYIYLEKNFKYEKTEIIDNVELSNIVIKKENDKGEPKLYKPVEDEKVMYKNTEENEISGITYTGELESNIKQLKISNQGGIIAFRYAINNIANYISDDAEEVNYSDLLKLTNITEEDIKTTISFDMIIKLTTGRTYQTNISIDIPTNEVIEKGTVGTEIKDFENLVFKRIEN